MLDQTTTAKVIQFKSSPRKDQFVETLHRRIDKYFKDNNITPYANGAMWFKTFVAITSWLAVYALIISDSLSIFATSGVYWTLLIIAFTLLGFVNIFIAFNISHDALHSAFSKKAWINKVLGYSFNFIGGNCYLFAKIHTTHHLFSNIHGIDPQMESHGVLRNTPHEPFKAKHRFQFAYFMFVYALGQIHWAVVKDFKWMFAEDHIGNEKNIVHPFSEILILIFSKAVYFGLTLGLPLLLISAPWWIIIIGFLSIHILPGLTFALIFQANHVFEGATYPLPGKDGNIENCFALHTLETTLDFARKNPLACWLMGNINVHVIHHMFPGYCHIHSGKLTEILIETCKEFGLEYMEVPTFRRAVGNHFRMLRHLSHPTAAVPQYKANNAMAMNPVAA